MKVGKPISKRVPVRLRHKIQKASAAKQKKERKLAKKNPEWRSRVKKDPGIPNLFPYKDKILHEIEESKRLKQEEIQRRKEENRLRQQQLRAGSDAVMADTDEPVVEGEMLDFDEESDAVDDAMDDVDDTNPMAALLASAQARAREYEPAEEDDMQEDDSDASSFADFDGADEQTSKSKPAQKDSSRRAFNKHFQELVDTSDVVLYVLDARDPQGTRSRETELAITSDPNKRLILILNKIDLIPPETLKAWTKHLRRSFPTLPLRASGPAPNAQTFDHKSLTPTATAQTLFRSLKSYAATRAAKRALNVGIVGYPNVGKSSVVNALVAQLGGKRGACPVGAEAGVTTSLRKVKIDSKLVVLDSPGIVFPSTSPSTTTTTPKAADKKQSRADQQARLILLNALPPHEILDPAPAVTLLLSRIAPSPTTWSALLALYTIPYIDPASSDLTNEFLIHVARKKGRLGKGGVPNLHAAGMAVLGDWRDGRIRGWMDPPADEAGGASSGVEEGVLEKKVVDGWAEEFKIEGLWE